ncbi:NAD(P)-dependent oxidoreductase [Shouchella clausii]|uniref:NAD-dependent epimerase/dehydratase family protein n=1 Tax=Shouchella clausii TaxID=79880 RepID=UPI003982951F
MRVLVTGGGGFIGSHVLKELIKKEISVVSFDISPIENAISEVMTKQEISKIKCVVGDICDFPSLCRVIQENQITHIIHLASMLIDAASKNPYRASEIMNGGMLNVLEAARIFKLEKIVWASSMSVFSSDYEGEPLSNDALHTPNTVYGTCKSWAEKIAEHYFKEWGIDSVGLRYGIVYGVGRLRGPSSFATNLIRQPALGKPFLFEYGESVVDWQYIDDIANITISALLADSLPERSYNVGGEEATVREVAKIVKEYIPEAEIDLGDQSLRIVPTGDSSALTRDLGMNDHTSIRVAVKNIIAACRESSRIVNS